MEASRKRRPAKLTRRRRDNLNNKQKHTCKGTDTGNLYRSYAARNAQRHRSMVLLKNVGTSQLFQKKDNAMREEGGRSIGKR